MNLDLDNDTMFAFLQDRPDKRIKTDFKKIQKEHEKLANEVENHSEEGSSDENEDHDAEDRESIMAFERQSSSSSSDGGTTDIMGASGSSFWKSDMGNVSSSKLKNKDTFDSAKFIAKLDEDESSKKIVGELNNLVKNSQFKPKFDEDDERQAPGPNDIITVTYTSTNEDSQNNTLVKPKQRLKKESSEVLLSPDPKNALGESKPLSYNFTAYKFISHR